MRSPSPLLGPVAGQWVGQWEWSEADSDVQDFKSSLWIYQLGCKRIAAIKDHCCNTIIRWCAPIAFHFASAQNGDLFPGPRNNQYLLGFSSFLFIPPSDYTAREALDENNLPESWVTSLISRQPTHAQDLSSMCVSGIDHPQSTGGTAATTTYSITWDS